MSSLYTTESGASGEVTTYTGLVDAFGGIATVVLAIIGLAGVNPEALMSIATIVFGAALLILAGAVLSEFAQMAVTEASSSGSASSSGGSVSVLFLVGVAGIVLGVLALLGVNAPILTSAAIIAFGAALLTSCSAVWRSLAWRSAASRTQARGLLARMVASEVAAGSSGFQGAAGLAMIVLGILAIAGIHSQLLNLVALLVAGGAVVMTGSTLGSAMMGFMRPTSRGSEATSQIGT
jgi:hypothetical protein